MSLHRLASACRAVGRQSCMNQETTSLILRPKKSSAIWLLIVCILFVAGSIWMAQEKRWIGYLCAGFFALGIPISIAQLIPGSTYLQITDNGLSFANMFRITNIPWNVIDHFFVVSMKRTGVTVHKMVGFNFVSSYDHAKTSRRVSTAIAKCEGALPDTYGKTAEELVDMLNRCLLEFTQKGGESGGPDGPVMASRGPHIIKRPFGSDQPK